MGVVGRRTAVVYARGPGVGSLVVPAVSETAPPASDDERHPVTPAYADVSLAVAKAVSPPTQIKTNGFVNTLRGTLNDALNSQALL